MTRALTITIGLGLVALLAILLLLNQCTATRNAKTETRLATGQAGATFVSGSDAATTVGNRMDADAATDQTTRENTNAIRHAEGADAPVSAPVSAAARAILCRRAAYRGKPECMQHAGPQ